MEITVIGGGNSGLTMAAHLSMEGNNVALWNRPGKAIDKLINTHTVYYEGVINGEVEINLVTDDIGEALADPDIILVTTPANSHKEIAELIAKNLTKETLIVLNPGRTFGALEFKETYEKYNQNLKQKIAETQTIIYTCRRTGEDSVNLIAFKNNVLISTFNANENREIISKLPNCIQGYFKPADSMIQTSMGNVGMILHCAPLLLNTGWTESPTNIYKYYYEGITPTVGKLIEKIDAERIQVSRELGVEVENTMDWLKRTYHVHGKSLYECIQNNEYYKTIDAPSSLAHRYILEDIPCGLVPLETIGKQFGLQMEKTSLIIDLASAMMEIDFRSVGRNFKDFFKERRIDDLIQLLKGCDQ